MGAAVVGAAGQFRLFHVTQECVVLSFDPRGDMSVIDEMFSTMGWHGNRQSRLLKAPKPCDIGEKRNHGHVRLENGYAESRCVEWEKGDC